MRFRASLQLLPMYELARHLMPFAMRRSINRRRPQTNRGAKSRRTVTKLHPKLIV
ncbi:hypothetical protein AM571_CH03806 [Rhizobium etli 8C-3]|uniref:Uncharacterized protein n=1 Tax=Rhizobium etli 8C-3 TaxID=538025 RepID=A0A1L5P8U1_RHIET|nr:hypothetical protein AM571_CH03806 [Rhizobium etli 8C-3]